MKPLHKKTTAKMVEPLKTGELLFNEGLIHPDDIDMALSIQKKRQESLTLNKKRLLGMILCDLNLITPMDNYYVLHKYNKLMSVQSALLLRQRLSKDIILQTQKDSRQQNIPFISYLQRTGLVATSEIQSLLFDLFHIPFRSIRDFAFNNQDKNNLIKVLDKDQSQTTKIIPLVLKNNTILFGITDPENLLFLKNLNERSPQYRFKALFTPFSGFLESYKLLYGNQQHIKLPKVKPLDLSLLLSFKTSVKDPKQEKEQIQTLYERYESLRQLSNNPKRDNLLNEFNEFIIQTHKQITREYKTQTIEFSLKKENQDVKIIAFPNNR